MLFREILDKFEICLGNEHGKREYCCLTFDFDRLASDAMQMIVKPIWLLQWLSVSLCRRRAAKPYWTMLDIRTSKCPSNYPDTKPRIIMVPVNGHCPYTSAAGDYREGWRAGRREITEGGDYFLVNYATAATLRNVSCYQGAMLFLHGSKRTQLRNWRAKVVLILWAQPGLLQQVL